MSEIIRNYGYLGTREESDQHFYITEGQWVAGYTVGIMLLGLVIIQLFPGAARYQM